MSNATEDQVAGEIVRLGYAVDDSTDQRRVLTFRVRFNERLSAYDALRAIDRYNDFDGEAVAQALENVLAPMLSTYAPSIEVGREGSPVVYIGPFFTDDREREEIMDALRMVAADECDFDGRMIRAWWD